MTNVAVIDAGNSIIKGKTASREVAFVHALKALSEAEYQNILTRAGRSGPDEDYLRVNGKPYVVGPSAERHGVLTRRTGAARYTADYYGVFVAAALARLYDKSGDVSVFGSHPPIDVIHRDDLMDAVLTTWEVECAGRTLTFEVKLANTFDEPAGGLFNVILTDDGKHYKNPAINGGRALVLDIGGHTVDFLAVNPGGEVDYSLNASVEIGIQDVLADFEQSFRAANPELVKARSTLPPERVRQALASGTFSGKGREYPCQAEADEAVSMLLNRIADAYQHKAGGGLDYDSLILTGGGSAMLHDRLLPLLDHERVILADDPATIHMANCRGGLKYWRLLEAMDLL